MAGTRSILMIGAGRLGGAILQGWRLTGAVRPEQIMLRVRGMTPGAEAAVAWGAALNPPDEALKAADVVVLAVKPQAWRGVAQAYAPLLAADALIVSLLVGVRAGEIQAGFGGRAVARAMPTTAVAVAKGAASIVASTAEARARAHALFGAIATCVDLDDEGLMDAASAVGGSAPAYFYALVEALQAAGEAQGLGADTARALVRSAFIGAAALLDGSGAEPADLRRQVASPGGTTEAALRVYLAEGGLDALSRDAVAAAVARAQQLAAAAPS